MTDVAERRKRGQDKAGGWGETIRTVVYAVLIALVVRTFAIEPFNIPSGSMIPTLLVGEAIFVGLEQAIREMRRIMDAARAASAVVDGEAS